MTWKSPKKIEERSEAAATVRSNNTWSVERRRFRTCFRWQTIWQRVHLPHRPAIREAAESTKIRIVFNVSAKENHQSPSLNDVTEVGPPILNKLWNVLIRNRMCPVTLTGDLKQAFLQIRIRKEDRDALRFHWIKSIESNDIETLRFTWAIFGLGESPFLLNGTIKEHLTTSKQCYPKSAAHIEEIEECLYVDDLITGDATTEEVQKVKETAIRVFRNAKFKFHKWHSNVKELDDFISTTKPDISFEKQESRTETSESKILGVS